MRMFICIATVLALAFAPAERSAEQEHGRLRSWLIQPTKLRLFAATTARIMSNTSCSSSTRSSN